jgi:tRNA(adenine34) deaminase
VFSRREFGSSIAAVACNSSLPAAAQSGDPGAAAPFAAHERAMRLAIGEARNNPAFPFGAVILRAADRRVMAAGCNKSAANPTFHGEIAAIDDYVARHGNRGWREMILYTTGEPCPMCMGAMVWAGMGGVVWGTSIEKLRRFGIDQILIRANAVVAAAPFYRGFILGDVLSAETDALFRDRRHP